MEENRTNNVKKNVFYSYTTTLTTSIISIVCRTVFVYTLGADYLGVSGLFSNVLGLLSFSELGIGTAINFSLYKPIAENDEEKIKSLLHLYKTAYRIIAVIVAITGLLIFPFLKYIVNTDIPMSEINIFYFIFLFNTVSSYFVTYKTAYVSALQKEYIVTNTTAIGTVVTNICQIILLFLGGNYLIFLLTASIIGLLQKTIAVVYLNKKYPILTEKQSLPLDAQTKSGIWRNVKALIIHKVGEVAVHQTDNIIISSFVSTVAVGIISNYTILNTFVSCFTNGFFNSFTAGLGNMIAKESKDKQWHIFKVYDLLGFWIFGFVMIAFITLSQPFITLWLGKKLLVDDFTMVLYFFSLYLQGMTIIPNNFKVAAGRFNEDKWVAFTQALTNLVASIIAVKLIGLPGVYVGTIIQRMIVVAVRPHIVFKYVLEKRSIEYYVRFVMRTLLALALCLVLWEIKKLILVEVTLLRFLVMCVLTFLIPNIAFLTVFGRSESFKDILARLKRR
ncbi:MAG: polysaccharide biosynthesis protein [Clostridia bacterium]|nr:polysaccharide biosynthesis protein [Spirochaetales bacterium]MDY3303389.1 polysaccharide biosynthesis protein [Clostridia bacterium]